MDPTMMKGFAVKGYCLSISNKGAIKENGHVVAVTMK